MKRLVAEFPLPENFLPALLTFSRNHNPVMILNSNREHQLSEDRYGSYDFLAAIGQTEEYFGGPGCFHILQEFLDSTRDWIFAAFTYDLKNQLEKLHSENKDRLLFPDYHFFRPRFVLAVPKGSSKILVYYLAESDNPATVENLIQQISSGSPSQTNRPGFTAPDDAVTGAAGETPGSISCSVTKEEYVSQVNRIKQHIRRGDIYEMNYCVEFFAQGLQPDPVRTYLKLNEISPMPFSCFYRTGEQYLLCASPERFLKKTGSKIISQPIKGTVRRGNNAEEDRKLKEHLFNDPKERSENVMIVDLVRNDLARTARRGTVAVEELFGIHSFETLHQMISTVASEVDLHMPVAEIIRAAFPMGSMTGAPKIRAMQLIEEYEQARRGLYSGSVGYFTPGDDVAGACFDLNVVIRSIGYHAKTKTLSFMAGSAITIHSDAESEYEECLLKARSMKQALTHD